MLHVKTSFMENVNTCHKGESQKTCLGFYPEVTVLCIAI
jgi:hypothetical protein